MNVLATPSTVTPNDLLNMPDAVAYELVDGQLRERNVSYLSAFVGGRVFARLNDYVSPRGLGWVAPADASFQCFSADPSRVRRADVSFIRASRMSVGEALTEGHCHLAPDLVVEVISPNDLAYRVDEKVEEWLTAGVHSVWVINPKLKKVSVSKSEFSIREFRGDELIVEESLLPGFSCPVSEFFRMPETLSVQQGQ